MWTGQVDVSFPWLLLTPTVPRHHLGKRSSLYCCCCCWRHFSAHIVHKGLENGLEKLLTNTPETLGQSSPQLFHFADFLRGLRGWHQVAHFFSFFFHRVWQRTGSGLAAERLRCEAGREDRCSGSPAGLLQPSCSALANRKRSLNGSHFSHQLVTTDAFLRISPRKQLHFQKRQ